MASGIKYVTCQCGKQLRFPYDDHDPEKTVIKIKCECGQMNYPPDRRRKAPDVVLPRP